MNKKLTTAITYKLPINEFDYVKEILSEIPELSKNLKKSDYWVPFIKGVINNGLRVVFLHLWNTEEQWHDGLHYKEEMVFEAFIGFDEFGMDLYSMGEFLVENADILCEKYENNPDFIFTQLDWDSPKEEIIKELISDLMKGDFAEDT